MLLRSVDYYSSSMSADEFKENVAAMRCHYSAQFRGLTDHQLHRLHCRIWDYIHWRNASTGAWDYPTLWAVFPGFALLDEEIRKEKKRRNSTVGVWKVN